MPDYKATVTKVTPMKDEHPHIIGEVKWDVVVIAFGETTQELITRPGVYRVGDVVAVRSIRQPDGEFPSVRLTH